jgi:hypothetical protein
MMRTVVFVLAFGALAASLATSGCQSCPDGNAGGSLYCHAASCATGESVCGGACSDLQSDRDNCGACGKACGDGMSCYGGQCAESCTGTETRCGGTCTDTTSDPTNCGQCGMACPQTQTCNASTCSCPVGDLVCGGLCTNPLKDNTHCGATADCLGANAGKVCGANEACSGGQCLSTRFYRGSLPQSMGRWTYGGVLGLTGANTDCNTHFPGTEVCTYAKLTSAAAKGELVNAADYNGVAVTQWWMDNAAALGNERCNFAEQEAIPWSYQTAHFGHVSHYVTLTPATGAISAELTGTIAGGTGLCSQTRFVACCSINTAP